MLRKWDLKIVLQKEAGGKQRRMPAHLQIAHALIEAIQRGRLAPGSPLPGTRDLAATLGVNRKTVQLAYDELVAQAWVKTEGTRGTFVSAMLPMVPDTSRRDRQASPEFRLRGATPDVPILLPEPGVITFDDGAPDTRLLPAETLAREMRRALLALSRKNRLGYGDPAGGIALRRAIADMLCLDRGLNCAPENICLTRGSQMAIYIAARILAGPGDTVAFETLSYPPAREAFRAAGARIAAIGLDAQGLRPDDLERLCRRRRVAAIYVTPHHQFPTTVTLPPERRIRLLALAEQFGFAIVEDDYDHEFHFAHRPILPLASVHGSAKGVYIGSLSKLLAPSLRIGYLVAAPAVIARAAAEIMLIDRQGDPVTEAAAAALMENGTLKSHTRKVLGIYAERRQFLFEALAARLGGAMDVVVPQGGLALWARFVAGLDPRRISQAAGVAFLPGTAFMTGDEPCDQAAGARLGFGSLDRRSLEEAVIRLARAIG